jgi:hypothetical protein
MVLVPVMLDGETERVFTVIVPVADRFPQPPVKVTV